MGDVAIRPARHRLTVDEYHRMGEAGVFDVADRIELVDGDLIDMAPIGQEHAAVTSRLVEAFVVACAGRATVWPQNPIWLDEASEPQPDVAVLRRRDDFYAMGERPGAADVLLAVEVADSSLRFDQTVKLPMYARAGVAEVWIVDVKRGVVEAYSDPAGEEYGRMVEYAAGQLVALVLAPEIMITV